MAYLYWSKASPHTPFPTGPDIIDLNLNPGELVTGMTNLAGKLYVFTADRAFVLKRKSRARIWFERIFTRGKSEWQSKKL